MPALPPPIPEIVLEEPEKTSRSRPILKWAGGKGQLLQQYGSFWPKQVRDYYEPFLGGAAVYFHLQNSGLVNANERGVYLSDSNRELINLYQQIQLGTEPMLKILEKHQKLHSEAYFYQVRAKDNRRMSRRHRAARTIYLNRTCFNGLYRVNSKGQFNVPFGRYTNPNIVDAPRLLAAHSALQGAELSFKDFAKAVKTAQPGDFVYFDPPYVPLSTSSSFTAYAKGGFGPEEQQRLAKVFRELAARGVQVMLSNSETEVVRELYQDCHIEVVQANRMINSKADGRAPIAELVVLANIR
jgi:DNA adenine methylase